MPYVDAERLVEKEVRIILDALEVSSDFFEYVNRVKRNKSRASVKSKLSVLNFLDVIVDLLELSLVVGDRVDAFAIVASSQHNNRARGVVLLMLLDEEVQLPEEQIAFLHCLL